MVRKTFLWLALFLTSVSLGMAQPSGDFGFAFDATDAPVWDLTGIYGVELTSVSIVHDQKGRLRGNGDALVQVGADVVAARYNVNGSVSGGGQDTRAKFTVKLTGQDVIAGD